MIEYSFSCLTLCLRYGVHASFMVRPSSKINYCEVGGIPAAVEKVVGIVGRDTTSRTHI